MIVNKRIPWARPDFWGNEKKYVSQALESSWISGGPFVNELERKFIDLSGKKYALAVSNGTVALHLAYMAIGIKAGDEIILPGFGYLAAANIAVQMQAKPVFCDVDKDTWCLKSENLESLISDRTRAVVLVHTYGNVCNIDSVLKITEKYKIPVIEDAAEAFPSKYKNKLAGSIGTIGTFSFHATKTIATGEGGMVITDDPHLSQNMELFRSHGLRRKKHYWHEVPGHNFRMSNIQAAIGCGQLEKIDKIVKERYRVFKAYKNNLKELSGIKFQVFGSDVEAVVWAVAVKISKRVFPQGRDTLILQMDQMGIELRPGFYTPSQLEYFDCQPLPSSDSLGESIVSLPSYPTLSDTEIEYICETLKSLIEG